MISMSYDFLCILVDVISFHQFVNACLFQKIARNVCRFLASVPKELMVQDVDFWGNILTTKYALEHLRRTRGQVVVTCSVGAFVPYPKQSFYNVSPRIHQQT